MPHASVKQTAPPRPWLAGVCAWIAWTLDWNVAGVRIGALLLLFIMPLATVVVYLIGALLLGLNSEPDRPPRTRSDSPMDRRIDAMDQRLREFDEELARRQRR